MKPVLLILAALALAGAVLVGCPAAHDGFPDTTCKSNSDCYPNETCVMNVCTPNNDLSAPDMALVFFKFDFSMPDGGGDL